MSSAIAISYDTCNNILVKKSKQGEWKKEEVKNIWSLIGRARGQPSRTPVTKHCWSIAVSIFVTRQYEELIRLACYVPRFWHLLFNIIVKIPNNFDKEF